MDTNINLFGELERWPVRSEMARIMRDAGFDVHEGQYSIRLNDCEHFVFQEYGGDIGDPVVEADGSSLATMTRDVQRVSDALADNEIRHRFEIYDGEQLVGYIHHNWPRSPHT